MEERSELPTVRLRPEQSVPVQRFAQFTIPPNLIPPGCSAITPQILPLLQLEPDQIERIVQSVPGGAANIQDIYPLTALQEGLLFHHVLSEQGDTYARPTLLEIESRTCLDTLIRALQCVVDRHDILRTAVLWEQLPRPVQVVYRKAAIPVEDLELDRDRDPREQANEWLKPERQRLDLRQAPLMRLQVAADPHSSRWYALLRLHHLASDGQSHETFIREVMAHLDGRAQTLPEPMPYRNHVAHALLHAQRYDAEAFFRRKLGDVAEPTAPFQLLDVHADGSQIDEDCLELELALALRARTQARRLRVSVAAVFHAAWGLVVSHTSVLDDVVFGTVLFGRLQTGAKTQQKLGMFLNTLPLRLRLGNVTAKELVVQTQGELLELLNYEQSSLVQAQRCSRVAGSAPLFSTLFNFRHRTRDSGSDWGGVPGVRMLACAVSKTGYPITLSVDDVGQGFVLTAQTDRRIDPRRITGYLRAAVQSLVEKLESEPQRLALELSILPEGERRQILESFNATGSEYPHEKLIHELFEDQVRRNPGATALVYAQERLTYEELNHRANQLARYLRNRRVGPEQLVVVCIEHGLERVVALLGILKAGGAYVPLDPNYPSRRLAYVLEDAAPRVILTLERLKSALPPTSADVIALDSAWNDIAAQEEGNLDPPSLQLTSRNLAYVIYTSGSTGEPKGVAAEHRGTVNRIFAQKGIAAFRDDDVCCQKTAIAFVDAVFETLGPLSHGRPLVLATEAEAKDIQKLGLLIERHAVTRLITVPSLARALLESAQVVRCLASLRNWTLSGEELAADLLSQLRHQLPGCAFINLYGSSEVAADATWFDGSHFEGDRVPIGRPIANTQVHILDCRLQPVPIGVIGEIYVGGAGVARGYLNRPQLTTERFIADPFSPDPQARLYKSGDLGRRRADGTLEYLGRSDHQVKLRGLRIELGEIEAQLIRHDKVKEAVVTGWEAAPGEKHLVAYLTWHDHYDLHDPIPDDQSDPRLEELRTHLWTVLPEYMVPSAFVILNSMPRTPSGKVDLRALPIPDPAAYPGRKYDAPRGKIEEALAQIWQELLGVRQVGREDNFFELGGHSLLGMKLVAGVAQRLGMQPAVVTVFQYPTIRQMAQLVETLLSENSAPVGAAAESDGGVL